MVAADDNRCGDLARGNHLVEAQPESRALAVAKPADAGRQSLERDLLASRLDPAAQALIVPEHLEHGTIGGGDVGRVARERRPAEWAAPPAELWPDVGGDESGIGERALEATKLSLDAQAVPVVEDLGAAVEE